MKEKKLYKSRTDKKLCGVCAGIARYFGIDPTIVRLIAVVLSLITAVVTGLIAYIICALIIPDDPEIVDV